MKDTSKLVYDVLSNDSILLDFLASNPPYFDSKMSSEKKHSIYPAGLAPFSANCPFITVQGGVISKVGKFLKDETYYIRVYNKRELSYFAINEICERIVDLFDEKIFNLDSRVMIRAKYDSTLQEATDEAMSLNFREIRFSIVLI